MPGNSRVSISIHCPSTPSWDRSSHELLPCRPEELRRTRSQTGVRSAGPCCHILCNFLAAKRFQHSRSSKRLAVDTTRTRSKTHSPFPILGYPTVMLQVCLLETRAGLVLEADSWRWRRPRLSQPVIAGAEGLSPCRRGRQLSTFILGLAGLSIASNLLMRTAQRLWGTRLRMGLCQ